MSSDHISYIIATTVTLVQWSDEELAALVAKVTPTAPILDQLAKRVAQELLKINR